MAIVICGSFIRLSKTANPAAANCAARLETNLQTYCTIAQSSYVGLFRP